MKLTIVSWLEPLIAHLWSKKSEILSIIDKDKYANVFDFPNYADLPKRISKKLSPDIVDIIQYNLVCCLRECRTEKQFAMRMIGALSNETINVK
jgi:hypothetical protein